MSDALRNALRYTPQDEAGAEKGGAGGEGKKGAEGELGTVEERAKRMGWTDQDAFRGDKAKWVDAATFVKNGEESLPILRERLRSLERTNMDLSKTAAEFKKMSDTAFERGYAKSKRDLEAEIEEKAKAGDGAGAKAAAKELAELEGEKKERAAAADRDPVFDNWVSENAWYNDPDMKIEAELMGIRLRKKGEKVDGLPFLEKVKEELKKAFPDKFGNPRRKEGSGVERSGAGGEEGSRGGKKGWDSLPTEAKEAGERYVKQKYFKDKAEYAASYWAQN